MGGGLVSVSARAAQASFVGFLLSARTQVYGGLLHGDAPPEAQAGDEAWQPLQLDLPMLARCYPRLQTAKLPIFREASLWPRNIHISPHRCLHSVCFVPKAEIEREREREREREEFDNGEADNVGAELPPMDGDEAASEEMSPSEYEAMLEALDEVCGSHPEQSPAEDGKQYHIIWAHVGPPVINLDSSHTWPLQGVTGVTFSVFLQK